MSTIQVELSMDLPHSLRRRWLKEALPTRPTSLWRW